jgi:hypothetical protein
MSIVAKAWHLENFFFAAISITKNYFCCAGEQNTNVRRILAQIVIVLGNHGCITGEMSSTRCCESLTFWCGSGSADPYL